MAPDQPPAHPHSSHIRSSWQPRTHTVWSGGSGRMQGRELWDQGFREQGPATAQSSVGTILRNSENITTPSPGTYTPISFYFNSFQSHFGKEVLSIRGNWNAKVESQEILGSKRQIWPWSAKWSRAKANRVLPRERSGHSKHPLPATQETHLHMDITRDDQHQNQIDYILWGQKWKSSIL